MAKVVLLKSDTEIIALSADKKDQLLTVPKNKSSDIENLIAERIRIGKELTAKLKDAGLVTAADDEETQVVEPG